MNIISTGVPPASLYQAYAAQLPGTRLSQPRKVKRAEDVAAVAVAKNPELQQVEHLEAWGIFARLLMSFGMHALLVAGGVVLMITGNVAGGLLVAGLGVMVMVGGIVSVLSLLAKPV